VAGRRAGCVEQARRHEGEQRKADDRQTGGDRKGVAPLGKHVGPLQVQNDEHADRHEEVRRAVVSVHRLDEPAMRKKDFLHRLFVEQADPAFEADDAHRVGERVNRNVLTIHDVGAELIAGEGVDGIKDADDQRFFPPPALVDPADGAEVHLPCDVAFLPHAMEG